MRRSAHTLVVPDFMTYFLCAERDEREIDRLGLASFDGSTCVLLRVGLHRKAGPNHCRSFTECCGTTCVQIDEASWKLVLEAHPFLEKLVTHLSESLDLFIGIKTMCRARHAALAWRWEAAAGNSHLGHVPKERGFLPEQCPST